ncbi:MAG: hypothetical protein ABGZ24_05270, partial [Fuerstiella sp.]
MPSLHALGGIPPPASTIAESRYVGRNGLFRFAREIFANQHRLKSSEPSGCNRKSLMVVTTDEEIPRGRPA